MKYFLAYILKIFWTIFRYVSMFTGVGILYHGMAKKKYWNRLLTAAASLGLQHKPSDYYDEFGELSGTIKDYSVCVRIDSSGTAAAGTHISISSYNTTAVTRLVLDGPGPLAPPAAGEKEFKTPSRVFNRIFKTRRADAGTAARLNADPELLKHFTEFHMQWIFRLTSFRLDFPYRPFTCCLNYGHFRNAYIPPEKLQLFLADLTALAIHFDTAISHPEGCMIPNTVSLPAGTAGCSGNK